MRRETRFGLVIGLVVAAAVQGASAAAGPPRGPRVSTVTLGIRHRVFHEFSDRQMVKLNQEFPLGDTEFSARVVQYVADFQMDLKRRRIFSLTDQPNNPAFKILVRKNKVPQDTTWAFLNAPPHFAARSFFAFQVLRIDFDDRPPLAADTLVATPGAAGGAPAARDSLGKP